MSDIKQRAMEWMETNDRLDTYHEFMLVKDLVAEVERLEKEQELSATISNRANSQIKHMFGEIEQLQSQLSAAQERVERLNDQLSSADLGWIGWQEKAGEWMERAEKAEDQLSRYQSAVEVEGSISYCGSIEVDIADVSKIPQTFRQRVKVLVMKEEGGE